MKKVLFTLLFLLTSTLAWCQLADTPLRVGVAGVTHDHLGGVVSRMKRRDIQVVGVWEANDIYRTNNSLTGKIDNRRFFKHLEDMLDQTKPEVVVAYGSILDHMKVVEACAPRHIHVMVEKPLATNYKQAMRMAELAKKYAIKILTNYETTWYATNHQAKKIVDSGQLGHINRINVYDGHEGPIELGCSKKFTDWLTDPVQNGGGAVIDFGCYGANLATWIMKGQKPTNVYAVLQQNKPAVYPKVDDDATIVLEYPNTTVLIMASWCWPTSRKDMYIYGDKGYVYQHTGTQMETMIDGKRQPEFKAPALPYPYDDSMSYLKAVLRGKITMDATDLSALENNLTVVQILEAAIESNRTGKAIKL